jgi:hypothetical protein
MSKTLKTYFLLRFLDEFLLFFSVFYMLVVMFSAIRYSVSYGVFDAKSILAFSLFIFPLVFVFSFYFSLFSFLREHLKKTRFLEVFGSARYGLFKFFLLISFLVFSIDLLFFFYISPKSFIYLKSRIFDVIPKIYVKEIKRYVFLWEDKFFVAQNFQKEGSDIILQEGFLFTGEKILKFSKIKISFEGTKSRFGKDLVELITDEGKKGKIEVIYNFSFSLSSVSCLPFFFSGFIKTALFCPPLLLGIFKLSRDTLEPLQFIFTSFLSHFFVMILGFYFVRKRRYNYL